jgi:hypothetical protein
MRPYVLHVEVPIPRGPRAKDTSDWQLSSSSQWQTPPPHFDDSLRYESELSLDYAN